MRAWLYGKQDFFKLLPTFASDRHSHVELGHRGQPVKWNVSCPEHRLDPIRVICVGNVACNTLGHGETMFDLYCFGF